MPYSFIALLIVYGERSGNSVRDYNRLLANGSRKLIYTQRQKSDGGYLLTMR
jgi:hypothetical protein